MVFARTTTAMLLCSIAFATAPASAKPLNKAPEFSRSLRHFGEPVEFTEMSARRRHKASRHHARRHQVMRYRVPRHARVAPRHVAGAVAVVDQHGVGGNAYALMAPSAPVAKTPAIRRRAAVARAVRTSGAKAYGAASAFGGTGVVAEARRYIGTNPTGRARLWCAHFMNMVLQRSGHRSSGSNMARSFASYGTRVSGPQVGAIAVMSRGKRGGHVGVVSGIDPNGNPIIISGNHGRRVAESRYSRGRVYAYVMP